MYEKLLERRSVRKYKPEQVSDELLDAVLKAGLYAPTANQSMRLSDVPDFSIACSSLINPSDNRSSARSIIRSMQRKWFVVSMISSTRILSPSIPMVFVSKM